MAATPLLADPQMLTRSAIFCSFVRIYIVEDCWPMSVVSNCAYEPVLQFVFVQFWISDKLIINSNCSVFQVGGVLIWVSVRGVAYFNFCFYTEFNQIQRINVLFLSINHARNSAKFCPFPVLFLDRNVLVFQFIRFSLQVYVCCTTSGKVLATVPIYEVSWPHCHSASICFLFRVSCVLLHSVAIRFIFFFCLCLPLLKFAFPNIFAAIYLMRLFVLPWIYSIYCVKYNFERFR